MLAEPWRIRLATVLLRSGANVLIRRRLRASYPSEVVEDEMLSIKKVAAELGMPFTRVRRLVVTGRLKAAVMPAGAGTWRVSRGALDTFRSDRIREERDRLSRARIRALDQLSVVWERLTETERAGLAQVLPRELYRPMVTVAQGEGASPERLHAAEALATAYGHHAAFVVGELALAMGHDLFWAVAGINSAVAMSRDTSMTSD